MLTPRWYALKAHAVREAMWACTARFQIGLAGRRSGKTEIWKRKLSKRALAFKKYADGRFLFTAPTNDQAVDIYWEDLKLLIPDRYIRRVRESKKQIQLITGTTIGVAGLDVPARVEGPPLDGIVLDEYADMKPETWSHHVRPALDAFNRNGWAAFIGKPKLGARHYRDLFKKAVAGRRGWAAFHWSAEDILSEEQIEAAKSDMDTLSYEYEYKAKWSAGGGQIYYPFSSTIHAAEKLTYDPYLPLLFFFDFNVQPGVALIAQEQFYDGNNSAVPTDERVTCVLGEVHIPNNSNTPVVCRRLIDDWGDHQAPVVAYGDATGGARGSAQVEGSDWELIETDLGNHFKQNFSTDVARANPPERARVNSVNTRLQTADGKVRLLIDSEDCTNLVEDLENVSVLKGSAGEIDKKSDKTLTHLTDSLGYYIEKEHPISGGHYETRDSVS